MSNRWVFLWCRQVSPPVNFSDSRGDFEPPGIRAVAAFLDEHEKVHDPRWVAVRVAETRAETAERELAQMPSSEFQLFASIVGLESIDLMLPAQVLFRSLLRPGECVPYAGVL
jgi:hypothetical protein